MSQDKDNYYLLEHGENFKLAKLDEDSTLSLPLLHLELDIHQVGLDDPCGSLPLRIVCDSMISGQSLVPFPAALCSRSICTPTWETTMNLMARDETNSQQIFRPPLLEMRFLEETLSSLSLWSKMS
ncbi:hypothetical protein WISP_12378 [Willisornis vidua]|uniref:Uncharacterized protein n=1 Tax=Willisornis vidua TaxID=1566151 RepID=A0ABQ9DRF9_9PASS|nr:hypothetical protein WISP_12378 [Willisornis vidua]